MRTPSRRFGWLVSGLLACAGPACTPKEASTPPAASGGPRPRRARSSSRASRTPPWRAPAGARRSGGQYLQGRAWVKKARDGTPAHAAAASWRAAAGHVGPGRGRVQGRGARRRWRSTRRRWRRGPTWAPPTSRSRSCCRPHASRRHDRQRESAAGRGRRSGQGGAATRARGRRPGRRLQPRARRARLRAAAQSTATARAAADGLIALGHPRGPAGRGARPASGSCCGARRRTRSRSSATATSWPSRRRTATPPSSSTGRRSSGSPTTSPRGCASRHLPGARDRALRQAAVRRGRCRVQAGREVGRRRGSPQAEQLKLVPDAAARDPRAVVHPAQ